MNQPIRKTALGQGAFYLLTGLWPIVHYRSFVKATGPKKDDWLVKTVGGLIAATGVALLAAGTRKDAVPGEARVLGAGHAAVLGLASGYYGAKGRVSKIYLLDSLTEVMLIAAWALASRQERMQAARP